MAGAKVFLVVAFALFIIPQFIKSLSRLDFPDGFEFGTSSSAFQYEGALSADGRMPSVWDEYARIPGKIVDSSTPDVAVDEYHRYEEDIEVMVELGVDAYRFSISWSRILPDPDGRLNQVGVSYYNRLIDRLISRRIKPYATILHSDTPLSLDKAYGSWLSSSIIQNYSIYAETCFALFGDRVKNWITLNEPHMQANSGYSIGHLAPGRCSVEVSSSCTGGDSATEPYLVLHNLILAHAAAVKIYRTKFQQQQRGLIGISIDAVWYEPLTSSVGDVSAAQLAREFETGCILDPLFFGRYPDSMVKLVGERLPEFSEEEAALVRGSVDILGVNHYTTYYATAGQGPPVSYVGYYKDHNVTVLGERDGVPIGQDVNGMNVVPWGLEKLLEYFRIRYNNPPVIITENGISDVINGDRADCVRVNYIRSYISSLLNAMRAGSDVRGYFVWSMFDNWEWTKGYTVKYGLYSIDFQNNLEKHPKESAKWFQKFLQKSNISYVR